MGKKYVIEALVKDNSQPVKYGEDGSVIVPIKKVLCNKLSLGSIKNPSDVIEFRIISMEE